MPVKDDPNNNSSIHITSWHAFFRGRGEGEGSSSSPDYNCDFHLRLRDVGLFDFFEETKSLKGNIELLCRLIHRGYHVIPTLKVGLDFSYQF